jgi:hypothetical protein
MFLGQSSAVSAKRGWGKFGAKSAQSETPVREVKGLSSRTKKMPVCEPSGCTAALSVMKVMGQADVRTAMRYQHPVLDSVREAIDQRNLRHNPRHNEIRVQ